ncbi:MAG: class II aldolase/adducin family protein [Chloracidobacterium sp.]|nr:class II aldolase/adducin family protein [Chloracidobacterium sp.]
MTAQNPTPSPTQELTDAGRDFYRRGWALGTSGNFSILLARKPLRLCITAAGNEKQRLTRPISLSWMTTLRSCRDLAARRMRRCCI